MADDVAAAGEIASSVSDLYLIKKYSSRRLYDSQLGRFITLEELDRLIRQGKTIRVQNAAGEDETRAILLQILSEREAGGEPLLSAEVLHEMVRIYGHAMHSPFGRYLREGLAVVRKQREAWRDSLPETLRVATQGVVDKLVSQSVDWMRSTQAIWSGDTTAVESQTQAAPEPAPKPKPVKPRSPRKRSARTAKPGKR